jgi:hypothetical protein
MVIGQVIINYREFCENIHHKNTPRQKLKGIE